MFLDNKLNKRVKNPILMLTIFIKTHICVEVFNNIDTDNDTDLLDEKAIQGTSQNVRQFL